MHKTVLPLVSQLSIRYDEARVPSPLKSKVCNTQACRGYGYPWIYTTSLVIPHDECRQGAYLRSLGREPVGG